MICLHERVRKNYDGGFEDDWECLGCPMKFFSRDDLDQARSEALKRQKESQQADESKPE